MMDTVMDTVLDTVMDTVMDTVKTPPDFEIQQKGVVCVEHPAYARAGLMSVSFKSPARGYTGIG